MRVNAEVVKTIGTKTLKTIGGFAKSTLSITIPIVVGSLFNSSVRDILEEMRYNGKVEYDDVVSVIMKSNTMSNDRVKMVSELKKNGSTEYYKAVISIVRSNMFSSSKLEAIRCLNDNEE